ncbi:kinase-like domain-containing protein [Tricladium varicosporioides]|nr:kinase-like domain-containing protein [Hymenoscyphus varicosporioides]
MMDQLYGGCPLDTIGHNYDNSEEDDETRKYSDTIDVLVAASAVGMRPIPRQQIWAHGSHFHRLGKPSSYFDVFLVNLTSKMTNISLFSQQGVNSTTIPGPIGMLVAVKRPKKPTQVGLQLQSFTESVEITENYTSLFDGPDKTWKPWVATLKSIQLEIQILSHGPIRNYQNIVSLLGFGWEKGPVVPFICLEYATFGALDEFIQEVTLSPVEKLELCIQVSLGLYVMHESGIIHGDLKPRNILMFKSPPHAKHTWMAKISDFGSSIVLGHNIDKTDFEYLGTAAWKAPETWLGKVPRESLEKCDVFSFALLIVFVFSNGQWSLATENPFSENWKAFWAEEFIHDTLKDILGSAYKNHIPGSLEPILNPVIKECLQAEPLQRCSIEFAYKKLSGFGMSKTPIDRLFKPSKAEFRMSAKFVPWECQEIIVKGLQKMAANESNPNYALAMLSLSNCYLYGFGLPHDMSRSIECLTRSAERGNHIAKVLCEIHPQLRNTEKTKEICSTCQDDINNETVSQNLLTWFRTNYSPLYKDFVRKLLLSSLGDLDLVSDVTAVMDTLMVSDDINKIYNPNEYTALHVAVIFGEYLDVRRALDLGADVNISSKNKVLPLASAIRLGRSDVVELLDKGVDCSCIDILGYSPLH